MKIKLNEYKKINNGNNKVKDYTFYIGKYNFTLKF